MKQRRIFYDLRYAENPNPYLARKGWLRYKDKVLGVSRYNFVDIAAFGIKLQPKHRHKRSIAKRELHRLFPHLVVRMGYIWLKEDNEWIFSVDYLCPKRRRLWINEY